MSRGWAAIAAAAGLAAACTSTGSTPTTTHTPSPQPTPVVTTPVGEALAALAADATRASYRATYVIHQHKPRSHGHMQVWHTSRSLRVDILQGRRTATLIVTKHGAYSCSRARRRRVCFRVARPGKPIPAPFTSAPYTLFTSDVRTLATATATFRVRAVGTTAGKPPARPAATCYAIRPTARSPKPRLARGIYCFAATGLLTSVRFPSGNTLQLVTMRLPRPTPPAFKPYASPTPLPG